MLASFRHLQVQSREEFRELIRTHPAARLQEFGGLNVVLVKIAEIESRWCIESNPS